MSALVGTVVGALLLLVAGLWPTDGSVLPTTSVSATVVDPPTAPAVSAPVGSARGAGTTIPADRGRPPVGLRVPALGVDAPVVPVGVDRTTGGMALPEDVATVGWYRFGPGFDAAQGSTVLAGHVDRVGQRGALFALRELGPGATLATTGRDGQARSYVVVARDQVPKSEVPLDQLFTRTGAPRLVVITCGGPFDESTRSYRDNLVITAVPTGAP